MGTGEKSTVSFTLLNQLTAHLSQWLLSCKLLRSTSTVIICELWVFYERINYINFQLVHIRIATASSGVILMCTMEFYRKLVEFLMFELIHRNCSKFVAHKSLKLLMTWHALWTLLYCSSILIDSVLLVITDYSATLVLYYHRTSIPEYRTKRMWRSWHFFWRYCSDQNYKYVMIRVPEDILLTSAQCLRRRLPDALALYGELFPISLGVIITSLWISHAICICNTVNTQWFLLSGSWSRRDVRGSLGR